MVYSAIIMFMICVLYSGCDTNEITHTAVFVNSYHQGYGSSDDVMEGLVENLPKDSINLITFFMDSKRNNSPEYLDSITHAIVDSIKIIQPDIIVLSDDNAVKYFTSHAELVSTRHAEVSASLSSIPIIFCGVNWSADNYNLPKDRVTGMLEVLPLHQLLDTVRYYYPEASEMMILTEYSNSAQNNKILLDTLFRNAGFVPDYELVVDFDEWKEEFLRGNQFKDLIYIPTNGAIKGWSEKEATEFVKQNIRVPVVTCDDFMMPYAVFGLTKVAKEQGEWAAEAVMRVLFESEAVGNIPITRNREYNKYINADLAKKINFKLTNIN